MTGGVERDPGALPAPWLTAALDMPRAHGPPPVRGVLRAEPGDFVVEERLGFEADAGRAHVLLLVEKKDANTLYVARMLARECGCRAMEVGFAGLKDRRAVARQWFSVPALRPADAWLGFAGDGFEVLEAHAHSRKLRRGALAGNRFAVRVRGLQGTTGALAGRVSAVAARGVPDYFGPQRFGRGGGNLLDLGEWTSGSPLPRQREARAFVLSTARALCFNATAAARVQDGSWDRLLDGEVVNLDGSGSVFVAGAVDEDLARRCAAFDVHPTGPLPGVGGPEPSGRAAAIEQQALEGLAPVVDALRTAGVGAGRRPLRVRPSGLEWSVEGDTLGVAFDLPRGAFATAVLREIVSTDDHAPEPEDD